MYKNTETRSHFNENSDNHSLDHSIESLLINSIHNIFSLDEKTHIESHDLFYNNSNLTSSDYILVLNMLIQLIDNSYDGFFLTDKNGRIFYVNQAVEKISGISREHILGKTAKDLLRDNFIISNSTKILDKNPLAVVQKVKTGVEVFINSIPFYDNSGKVMCYIGNYRNISQLNKLLKVEDTKEEKKKNGRELKEMRNKFLERNKIIAKSKEMDTMLEKGIKIAQVDANVLLTGESGTGKEVIADLIHKCSNRKDYPYVKINCGAIPESLIESELFGYEKGAFTGAQKGGKHGILEMGHNGTVVLDEIGDLPLNLQVRLLRFLESQEIYRVGSVKPIKLNVRVIAITNKNLEEMVQQGEFREDLYYRLNVASINLPPLRERNDDIIPLACFFLKEFNRKYGTDKIFSTEVCNQLESYHWPGNVRELRNIIEKTAIFSSEKQINKNDLPQNLLIESSDIYYRIFDENSLGLKEAKELFEKEIVKKAIDKYKSARKAAEILKIDHSNVIRKAKKYKLY